MTFECSIEIAATPQGVFAFLTEPELVKLWQLDLPEPPPLPAGGLRVGTRQSATVEEHGRKMAIETVVTDLIVNELIAWEMLSPNADLHTEFRLIPQGAATLLRQRVTMKPKGFIRLFWPLLRGVFPRKARSRLKLLKERVEACPNATVAAV